jgi:hypothetical protein
MRIGQYLTVAQHYAGSDAPALPDANHTVANLLGDALDLLLDYVECSHCGLLVSSNLQVTT